MKVLEAVNGEAQVLLGCVVIIEQRQADRAPVSFWGELSRLPALIV